MAAIVASLVKAAPPEPRAASPRRCQSDSSWRRSIFLAIQTSGPFYIELISVFNFVFIFPPSFLLFAPSSYQYDFYRVNKEKANVWMVISDVGWYRSSAYLLRSAKKLIRKQTGFAHLNEDGPEYYYNLAN